MSLQNKCITAVEHVYHRLIQEHAHPFIWNSRASITAKEKLRQVSLLFSWEENNSCLKFHECGDALRFVKIWASEVKPHLHPETGTY